MATLRVPDLTPAEHQGLPVVLDGQWKVPGTLHWNNRSKRWELSIPRPRRKDQHPQRLWLDDRDTVTTDGGA